MDTERRAFIASADLRVTLRSILLTSADDEVEAVRSDLVHEGLDLIAAYRRIESEEKRKLILQMVRELADGDKGDAHPHR